MATLRFLALLPFLLCVSVPLAAAQDRPAAMIVLDGSGSMAGWLDGAKASKLDMARSTLQQVLGKLPPATAVGLVAFGHRRKGNCADVEMMVAPEAASVGKTLGALAGVNPAGKGPVSNALRQAAVTLGAGAKRSIILLHDDPDNCSPDACADAASIAASHPGVPIHVITLGPKPATRAAMACVVKVTGGKLFEAADEAGLAASLTDAIKIAGLDQAVPEPKLAARPEGSAAKTLSVAGLQLSASLVPGGPPIEGPVNWRVTREGDAGTAIIEERSPDLTQPMPPGRYGVEARLGLAHAAQTIDVAEGKPSVAEFNFDAGVMTIARDSARGSGQLITIARAGKDDSGKGGLTPVFVGRVPETPLLVPAGTYDIRLDDGLAHRQQRVEVRAGAETSIGQAVPSGRLELDAVSVQDGPALETVTYTIEQDDPDAPQGRREIARSAAAKPDFTLAAGTYYVTARSKQVEARERLAISAGSTVKQTMVLALSRLSLSAKADASLSPNQQALNFRVISLDSNQEVARSSASSPVVTLPAGRYRVEAKLGSENAKATSDVEVNAGKDAAVVLDVAAGQVGFDRDALAAARGTGDGLIEVRDETGNVVWHAGAGETATALLAPGRYKYRTPAAVEKTFEVRAGERQTLRFD